MAITCGALISPCGVSHSSTIGSTPAKTNLNTAQVALSIKQSILSQRHLNAKVVCPATVPQEKGKPSSGSNSTATPRAMDSSTCLGTAK
jgi:hypothetical protein